QVGHWTVSLGPDGVEIHEEQAPKAHSHLQPRNFAALPSDGFEYGSIGWAEGRSGSFDGVRFTIDSGGVTLSGPVPPTPDWPQDEPEPTPEPAPEPEPVKTAAAGFTDTAGHT